MIQWTQVPTGASGSSAIKAKALVPRGGFSHLRGRERSAPSQVYLRGISPPFSKAELFISIAMADPPLARENIQRTAIRIRLGLIITILGPFRQPTPP